MECVRIECGWVYDAASGHLADPQASFHQRADFGIQQQRTYYSVDTGKYCTAPWLAKCLYKHIYSAIA